MITKEEYIAAMAVVEGYQEQLKAGISNFLEHGEPTLRDFIENADISTRLRNVLANIANPNNERQVLLEEIKESELSMHRNIGRASMREFAEKRNKYLQGR